MMEAGAMGYIFKDSSQEELQLPLKLFMEEKNTLIKSYLIFLLSDENLLLK